MSSSPVASVVIPCLNQARYLRAALESVHTQSLSAIETIVVDDGSIDDTAAVADAAGAIVVRQSNQGLSAARNQGLRLANAPYVVFLDADDELERDAVESGVAALERRPDAWMVGRYCVLIDSQGRPLPTNSMAPKTADLYGEWLVRNLVWTPGAAVFRRQPLLDIGGFPPALGPASDYAVYLELARAGRVIFDLRQAVRYRQHDSNMSRDAIVMLERDDGRVTPGTATRSGTTPTAVPARTRRLAHLLRRPDHPAAESGRAKRRDRSTATECNRSAVETMQGTRAHAPPPQNQPSYSGASSRGHRAGALRNVSGKRRAVIAFGRSALTKITDLAGRSSEPSAGVQDLRASCAVGGASRRRHSSWFGIVPRAAVHGR